MTACIYKIPVPQSSVDQPLAKEPEDSRYEIGAQDVIFLLMVPSDGRLGLRDQFQDSKNEVYTAVVVKLFENRDINYTIVLPKVL